MQCSVCVRVTLGVISDTERSVCVRVTHGVISDIEYSVVCEHSDIERSVVCVFTCLMALFQTLSAV